MENREINPSCENCKYFRQHYTMNYSSFHTVCCGHCTNRELTPKERRTFPFTNGCEMWIPNDKEKEVIAKSIESSIRNMEKHLYYIEQILKLDKK